MGREGEVIDLGGRVELASYTVSDSSANDSTIRRDWAAVRSIESPVQTASRVDCHRYDVHRTPAIRNATWLYPEKLFRVDSIRAAGTHFTGIPSKGPGMPCHFVTMYARVSRACRPS